MVLTGAARSGKPMFNPGFRRRARRLPFRRRFRGRGRGRRRFPVRSTIVRTLQPEVKNHGTSFSNIAFDSSNSLVERLSAIAQGTAGGRPTAQRIGNKIQPVGLTFRYQIRGDAGPRKLGTAACAIVQFKASESAGAGPALVRYVKASDEPLSALLQDVNKTFKTHARRIHTVQALTAGEFTRHITSGVGQIMVPRHRLLPVTYSGNAAGDEDTGSVIAFFWTNFLDPTNQCLVDYSYTLHFIDA